MLALWDANNPKQPRAKQPQPKQTPRATPTHDHDLTLKRIELESFGRLQLRKELENNLEHGI